MLVIDVVVVLILDFLYGSARGYLLTALRVAELIGSDFTASLAARGRNTGRFLLVFLDPVNPRRGRSNRAILP
jgi:hypothetical protein